MVPSPGTGQGENLARVWSESLGLSWVALEDARHRHERDAAQAGLNEAAGRELKRLWGLRTPQTCVIRDQSGRVNGQTACARSSRPARCAITTRFVLATAIAAWLGEHRRAVGYSGGSSDIGESHRARLAS